MGAKTGTKTPTSVTIPEGFEFGTPRPRNGTNSGKRAGRCPSPPPPSRTSSRERDSASFVGAKPSRRMASSPDASQSSSSSLESSSASSVDFVRYRVGKKLGEGAFGAVYSGHNILTQQPVAIKAERVYRSCPTTSSGACLLEHEKDVLVDLVGGVGIPQPVYYDIIKLRNGAVFRVLVLELLGRALFDLLEECGGRFSVKTVAMVADQLLARLQYIHSKGFIHRDLKPENVLIGREGMAHVIYAVDFGLASRASLPTPPASTSGQSMSSSDSQSTPLHHHNKQTTPIRGSHESVTVQLKPHEPGLPTFRLVLRRKRPVSDEQDQELQVQGPPSKRRQTPVTPRQRKTGERTRRCTATVSEVNASTPEVRSPVADARATPMVSPLPRQRCHVPESPTELKPESCAKPVKGTQCVGTIRYMSRASHFGVAQTPADDLESLGYILIYLAKGSLPWQRKSIPGTMMLLQKDPVNWPRSGQPYRELIGWIKSEIPLEQLCLGLPYEFQLYMRYVMEHSAVPVRRYAHGKEYRTPGGLGSTINSETVDYAYLRGLFQHISRREGWTFDWRYDWTRMSTTSGVPSPVSHHDNPVCLSKPKQEAPKGGADCEVVDTGNNGTSATPGLVDRVHDHVDARSFSYPDAWKIPFQHPGNASSAVHQARIDPWRMHPALHPVTIAGANHDTLGFVTASRAAMKLQQQHQKEQLQTAYIQHPSYCHGDLQASWPQPRTRPLTKGKARGHSRDIREVGPDHSHMHQNPLPLDVPIAVVPINDPPSGAPCTTTADDSTSPHLRYQHIPNQVVVNQSPLVKYQRQSFFDGRKVFLDSVNQRQTHLQLSPTKQQAYHLGVGDCHDHVPLVSHQPPPQQLPGFHSHQMVPIAPPPHHLPALRSPRDAGGRPNSHYELLDRLGPLELPDHGPASFPPQPTSLSTNLLASGFPDFREGDPEPHHSPWRQRHPSDGRYLPYESFPVYKFLPRDASSTEYSPRFMPRHVRGHAS